MSQTPRYEAEKKVLNTNKCQRSILFSTVMQFIISFKDLESRKHYLVKISVVVFK